ncbi:hypothetical protein ASC84_00495 [Acinetobacter sp. Root1280]|uniref:DEAD/DEAH box helicase n=1 Tax=Acinetobacter sp. Root1280 TaxID=1736444 RepID=UPI0006F8280F|nr:DEAD/DEAH box helicase [Acinetobacter sp. Root1280]KQX03218.1 hypothetical protein ASC84_00495 [Acinetobacter sp. Root1280]
MINLSLLKENERFSTNIEKLFLNEKLSESELTFILSCAILFLKKYENDKIEKNCLTFAYFILLKVALVNDYYTPLYDISINMGWYPISRFIFDKNLNASNNLSQVISDAKVDKYKFDEIIETFKQKTNRVDLLDSKYIEKAYIAPTSFGKSKLIQEFLKRKEYTKIAIIVPTKSLLMQTFNTIKKLFNERKIIFHDEMYMGENEFISIFTQERALRLLSKNKGLSFDLLVIDEAHNLMDKDIRSILLLRLIRLNEIRNKLSNVLYLSPLIANIENIKHSGDQKVFERRIDFNIKEVSIHLYDQDQNHYIYNKYLDKYYNIKRYHNYLDYIFSKEKNKNFFYLRKPKSVELLAEEICSKKIYKTSDNLDLISKSLSDNIHKDFYCVDYVKKGLIYLHGKLPDIVKEYLEYKFKSIFEIKYLVSNSVILEGVNLPIDNLYILNTYMLDTKKLINLIGRVNRLNEVFDLDNNNLNKLNPDVHFVYADNFTSKNSKLRSTISKIKTGVFTDVVANPVLLNYSFNKNDKNKTEMTTDKLVELEVESENMIKFREDFLIKNDHNEEFKLKCSLIESNIDSIYKNFEKSYNILELKFKIYKNNHEWNEKDVLDKISLFFIEDLEDEINEKNLLRLAKVEAKKFYRVFNENRQKLNMSENIKNMLRYFYSIREEFAGKNFYVGSSYGEFSISDDSYFKNYIDLSEKNEKEMVNIALVKIKMESDFLSFKLYKFANVLFDINLLNEDEYNLFIYGTVNKESNDYIRLGLSSNIVFALEKNNQLKNLALNKNGAIIANEEFKRFMLEQDDLFKFELSKFIS